jgi:uncharacterized phiE125 gp8 family phage protein
MSMQRITPITSAVSVRELMRHLRIDEEQDAATLASLGAAATQFAEDFCRRAMGTGDTFRATFDGFAGEQQLVIPLGPVVAITSIVYDDAAGDAQTWDAAEYELRRNELGEDIVVPLVSWPSDVSSQPGSVRVTLTAGDGPPVNAALAVRMLVGEWYEHREGLAMRGGSGPIPDGVMRLLWLVREQL